MMIMMMMMMMVVVVTIGNMDGRVTELQKRNEGISRASLETLNILKTIQKKLTPQEVSSKRGE